MAQDSSSNHRSGQGSAEKKDPYIIGMGVVAIDYIILMPHTPEPGEKLRSTNWFIQGGGLIGTGLTAVARLGGKPTYVGKLGNGSNAELAIKDLMTEGVDTSHVVRSSGGPYIAWVLVSSDTGERTIAISDKEVQPIFPEEIERSFVESAGAVLVDHLWPETATEMVRWAREAGVPTVADVEKSGDKELQLLESVDYPIVSTRLAREVTGEDRPWEAVRKFVRREGQVAVVTAGSDGCYVAHAASGEVHHQPAFKVDVADTTGAGDVFHGAFCVGLTKGWSLPVIVEFATCVAALKCRQPGGRTGIPSFEETRKFLLAKGSPETSKVFAAM